MAIYKIMLPNPPAQSPPLGINWVECICKNCGQRFRLPRSMTKRPNHGAGNYCSRKCSAIARFSGKPSWNRGKTKTITKPCEYCGKPQTRKPSRFANKRVFCNASCMQAYRLERSIQPKFHIYHKNRHRYAKIFGSACIVCGFDRLIEYAHIIPMKLGGKSNKQNLLPMCPNHHNLFDRGLLNESEINLVDTYIRTLGLSPEEYSKISWSSLRDHYALLQKPPEKQGRSWHHRTRKE